MTRMKHRRPSVSPLGAPLAQRVHSARVASSARSQQRVLAHVRVVNCCGRARRVLVEPERRGIGLLVGGGCNALPGRDGAVAKLNSRC
eukprot:scaffold106232_cov114-Phaeocystis_antarctica.AAC.1